MSKQTQLITWLKEAHLMEVAVSAFFEKQVEETKHQPDIQKRLFLHLEETRNHEDLIIECLKKLNEETLSHQENSSRVVDSVGAFFDVSSQDRLVKWIISDIAIEHIEIGVYSSILTLANSLEEGFIIQTCQNILNEEQTMSEWLEASLPDVVSIHVDTLHDEEFEEEGDSGDDTDEGTIIHMLSHDDIVKRKILS